VKQKLRKKSEGVRKKVSVYLYAEQSQQIEERAKDRGSSTSAVLADIIEGALEGNGQGESPLTRIENSIALLASRLSKIERVQRTLVLNTAYGRGFAVGSVRTETSEKRKAIEQEMAKTYDRQRDFFFDLFPDQKESET
jgi:hypothetical protein